MKEKVKKLTVKEKRFVEEYVFDWNASRAAVAAGYSKKTARYIGYENLTKPHIKAYVDEVKNDLERLSGISKLRVLSEHSKIAFSSIAHLHNTWIDRKEFDQLTNDQKACIAEISTQTRTVLDNERLKEVEFVKIKLYDKQKALDSISKLFGYESASKIEHSGSVEQKIDLSALTTEELIKRSEAIKKLKPE